MTKIYKEKYKGFTISYDSHGYIATKDNVMIYGDSYFQVLLNVDLWLLNGKG